MTENPMPLHQDMSGVDIFSVRVFSDWTISVQFTFWIVGALIAALILVCVWRWTRYSATWKDFEIDQAEIGTGTGKLSLRPNTTDRQVAYAMWVELSTRKIGLPIDFDHDLISEIYDSWYQFSAAIVNNPQAGDPPFGTTNKNTANQGDR